MNRILILHTHYNTNKLPLSIAPKSNRSTLLRYQLAHSPIPIINPQYHNLSSQAPTPIQPLHNLLLNYTHSVLPYPALLIPHYHLNQHTSQSLKIVTKHLPTTCSQLSSHISCDLQLPFDYLCSTPATLQTKSKLYMLHHCTQTSFLTYYLLQSYLISASK